MVAIARGKATDTATEYGAVGGSRTCLSEASPADQYEELQSVLTEACNMVSLGSFSLPKQREEHVTRADPSSRD